MTSSPTWSWRWPVVGVVVVTVLWPVGLAVLAGTPAAQHVSNLGLTAIASAAGWTALRRGRAHDGATRRFWQLLGAGVLSWALGQAVWTWYESVLGQEVPFPSPADVGYLGLPPLAAAALLQLPLASPSLAGRVRTILDGLVVATSLLLCSWLLVLGQTFALGGDEVVPQAISLAYPLGDVVVITMVLYTWLRARQQHEPLPVSLPLVGTGLLAFAVSDSGFTYLTNAGAYSSGNLIDTGWFMGFALMTLAALRRPVPPGSSRGPSGRSASGSLLPYTAVSVALGTSVLEFMRSGYSGSFSFWVRTTMMALLVARQVLTLRENASLTRDLERRVDDRTAELRASQQRFSALVQHSSDLVMVVDRAGVVTYQSRSSERMLGYGPDELVGRSVLELVEGDGRADFLAFLLAAPAGRERVRTVLSSWRHSSGRSCQVEVTMTDLLDNADVGGVVLNARDVTERVVLEEQLTRQAFVDALTGLPNRALFKDRLEHGMHRGLEDETPLTVLFLDLDGFKAVNDTLGHGAGDSLLIQVAERLSSVVHPDDTVARFGGDEFAVLIDPGHEAGYAAELAARIVERIGTPFAVGSEEVFVAVSIGIARLDDADFDADQLLRNADLAMYQAKATPTGGVTAYHPDMHAGLVERVRLEADLRRALELGQLYLDYQPIVAMRTGRMTGVEALVRWQHPERGLITPTEFVPLAESTGLIRDIGRWVLLEACRQTVRWAVAVPGSAPLKMNVNVSGQQLLQPGLVDVVAGVLEETGLAPAQLNLEMTESVLIDSSDRTLAVLLALRTMGIRLSLDDFGTGYSSLSYLHRFPIDTLKIDRSFVERVSTGADGALVATILALATSLNMDTVAEGIETLEQSLRLQEQGCVLGQGFYFSEPTSPAGIEALLREQGPRPVGPRRGGATVPTARRGGGQRQPRARVASTTRS